MILETDLTFLNTLYTDKHLRNVANRITDYRVKLKTLLR